MHDTWPTLAALLVGAAALWYVLQRKDFVIRVRGGRCLCTGSIPRAIHPAVAQFLLDDLRVRGRVTVSGTRRGGRLRLWYRGRLTPGDKQRIRNFLLTHR